MPRYDDQDDYDDRRTARRRYDDDDDEEQYGDEGRGRRRFQDDDGEYDFRKRDAPHSGLGIVSLVIAVIAGVAMLTLFGAAAVLTEEAGGDLDESSPTAIVLGVCAFAAFGLTLVGLGLGVAGMLQKDRNKLFGTLGLVANTLVILGSLSLICAGALFN
jgi:hypothetical protein